MKRPKDEAHPINSALDTVAAVRDQVNKEAETILDQISRGENYACHDPDYFYEVAAAERAVKFEARSAVGDVIFAALKVNSALKNGGVKVTQGR